jgi:hypothetical protein
MIVLLPTMIIWQAALTVRYSGSGSLSVGVCLVDFLFGGMGRKIHPFEAIRKAGMPRQNTSAEVAASWGTCSDFCSENAIFVISKHRNLLIISKWLPRMDSNHE